VQGALCPKAATTTMSDRCFNRCTGRWAVDPFIERNTTLAARLALPYAALLLATGPIAQADAFTADAEATYTSDSNVTRAQYVGDIQRDQFLSVTAALNYLQWLNPNHRLVYRGFVRAENYRKYDKLSNTTAGLDLAWQYRESGAFTAPLYGVFAKAAIDEYKSTLRDSNLYSAGVSWRKPATDRIQFTAIAAHNWRDSDSTVFDTQDNSFLLNTDYAIGPHSTLYLTYNYLYGDIVSTTTSSTTPRLAFIDNADAINADDAFGSNAIAYRLKAHTNVVTLGTNFKLAETQSLDFSGRWIESNATVGISYTRWQLSLAYLVRF